MNEREAFEQFREDYKGGGEGSHFIVEDVFAAGYQAALASQQKPVAGLDEVAEKVWRERAWLERPELVQFRDAVRAIVAELTKGQEPAATKKSNGIVLHTGWDDRPDGTKLYAAPTPAVPTGWKLVGQEPDGEWVDIQVGMEVIRFYAAAPEVKQ